MRDWNQQKQIDDRCRHSIAPKSLSLKFSELRKWTTNFHRWKIQHEWQGQRFGGRGPHCRSPPLPSSRPPFGSAPVKKEKGIECMYVLLPHSFGGWCLWTCFVLILALKWMRSTLRVCCGSNTVFGLPPYINKVPFLYFSICHWTLGMVATNKAAPLACFGR